MKHFTSILLILLIPIIASATELTISALSGKWEFTHMILDGERERRVNMLVEFLPDGSAISYDKSGKEKDRTTYLIKDGMILYNGKRGVEKWKVKSFQTDKLYVDHSGAEMFFERR